MDQQNIRVLRLTGHAAFGEIFAIDAIRHVVPLKNASAGGATRGSSVTEISVNSPFRTLGEFAAFWPAFGPY